MSNFVELAHSLFFHVAAADPAGHTHPDEVNWLAIGVSTSIIFSLVTSVFVAIKTFRQNPPHHEKYATKKEINDLERRIKERLDREIELVGKSISGVERTILRSLGKLEDQFEGLESTIQNEFKKLNRDIGHLEKTEKTGGTGTNSTPS